MVERNDVKYVMRSWAGEGGCTGEECRPRLIGFKNSTNIKIEDVHLRQSVDWTLVLYSCTDVSIRGISIFGDNMIPNNDGCACCHLSILFTFSYVVMNINFQPRPTLELI